MVKLTDLKAKNIKPGDKPIADGTVTGLRLYPTKIKGQGKWMLRFVSPETNKRRDMGFGTYPDVSIVDVRKSGMTARELINEGRDPIEAREEGKAIRHAEVQDLTFENAARDVYETLKSGWKNKKHAAQWLTTLETYVFPKIGSHKVKKLKARDFADTLNTIWLTKPETGRRVKQRCNTVMDWCVAQDLIDANPVSVVSKLLPKQAGNRERIVHQPSMPWRSLPEFIQVYLRADKPSLSKTMLEFLILTASRSGEVRGMIWDEVDLGAGVWVVPVDRMKSKAEHRVPLSGRAVEILKAQKESDAHSTLVFPSLRGKVPSDMILTQYLRGIDAVSNTVGRTATAHGFRSSFRDWASEHGYSRDLAERSLAHTIRNQAEAAYHRTDLLDQRRVMMEAWAQHVCGTAGHGNKVVKLKQAGKQ